MGIQHVQFVNKPFKVWLVLVTSLVLVGGSIVNNPRAEAVAPSLTVCASGCPFTTIQAAIDAADDDSTITVGPGTYVELLTVDKPLELLGPNSNVSGMGTRVKEAVIQFPTEAPGYSTLITISPNLSGVTISGFDLRAQDSRLPNADYLIYTHNANDLTVRNNRMYSSEISVYITADFNANRSGLMIAGNFIDGGAFVNSVYNRGMYVGGTAGTIEDNVVLNTGIGIQYMPYKNPNPGLIQRNVVSAGQTGLYHNYQTKGGAPVIWRDNHVSIAPNDRAGIRANLDPADRFTTPLVFRAIDARTFGTEETGAAPQVSFINNRFDGSTDSPHYSDIIGYRNGRSGETANTGVATLSNNCFANFTKFVYNYSSVEQVATNNWWGTADVPTITAGMSGAGKPAVGPVSFGSPLSSCNLPALQSARIPTFGSTVRTADGFTLRISNYSAPFGWAISSSLPSASAIFNPTTGLVEVTGVAANTSSTITVTTSRDGFNRGSSTSSVIKSLPTVVGQLVPSFGTATRTETGFTVPITNYDSNYSWSATATNSGTATISGTGIVTVTGVSAGQSSAVTVSTNRTGYIAGESTSGSVEALNAKLIPTFGTPALTSTSIEIQITNYDDSFGWTPVASAGSASISGTGLVTVTGLSAGQSARITVSTSKSGHSPGSASVSPNSLMSERTPKFGSNVRTAGGFTMRISNYSPLFEWTVSSSRAGAVATIHPVTGVMTVTGVPGNTASTVTVTASRVGYRTGTADSRSVKSLP
jgi:hypothetical protein